MSQHPIVTAVQDAAAEGPSGGAGEEGGEEGGGQPGGKGKKTIHAAVLQPKTYKKLSNTNLIDRPCVPY